MVVGVISLLCICTYVFGVYLPQSAEMHRTGLPQEPEYFVNREEEQEQIMRSVTGTISHRSRIITITGSPGYGKTTLAKVCGHRFVSQGIPVRYVDLQDVCDIQGIIGEILHAVGSTDRYPSKKRLRRWARKRGNGLLVLVLDNVDCFTLSGEGLKKEFSHLIKDFIVEPSLAIHVIVTTQYQLGYINSFQLIALDRFSETHAKELLLNRNPTLTANVTTILANFTDGNPLALQILSALLLKPNAPPILVLLEQLRFDPVKTLSRDDVHEQLNHVFKVAISYLSDADQQCFLVVNQFPGSFDEASASAVLLHFANESVPTCLGHLLDRSLLEYNRNTQRYVVIPLLKAFVTGSSISQRYTVIVSRFFPVYAKHLLQAAMKHQLLSDMHLLNFLKANYVGVQYLINGYVSRSGNASDFDTSLDLILPFVLATFDMLPILQPVDTVRMFWFSVQNLTWNITSKGFEGQCHEYFERAIVFETLFADYLLSAGRNDTVEAGRLSSRAQILSEKFIEHQDFIASDCIETITLLRYFGHVAKYSMDEAVYHNLVKAIMHLASSKNHSSTDADYNIGVIYFEMTEYNLAVEFLNRSLTSNQGTQRFSAAKMMVLAFQRSGQHKLAVDTVTRLVPYLWKQASLEFHTSRLALLNVANLNYETALQTTIEMYNRFADSVFAAVDLSITVNRTALSLQLLKHVIIFCKVNILEPPTIQYFLKHCLDEPRGSHLSQPIWMYRFWKIRSTMTGQCLVYMQYLLHRTRVLCVLSKALMNTFLNAKVYTIAHKMSRQMTQLFSDLVDDEDFWKRMHDIECGRMETDSVECQMTRNQVQLLWQLQYDLADGLSMLFSSLGILEQAKEYTEIALEKLPKSSVKKKWKVMVDHKLNLAKIELSLGNYWNAVYILHNCSLTIDKETIENIYKSAQPSTTWENSRDLSSPDGHLSIRLHYIYHIFNPSKVLSAVDSDKASLILHTGIVIAINLLLFVIIAAVLWLLIITILFMFGSTLHCVKRICSCCSDQHRYSDRTRLYFFDLTTVTCAFSHIVVFFAYILHFHAITLLAYIYLNYMHVITLNENTS